MMKSLFSVFVIGLAALLASGIFAANALAQDSRPALVLENDYVRLEFEKEHFGLSAMIDKSTWMNHVQDIEGGHMLFQLLLRRGTQENRLTNLDRPGTSANIQYLAGGVQRAVLEWKNIRYWREDNALTITVTVDLPKNSGIAEWRINVENNSDMWGLWEVHFPYFTGYLESAKYDLAIPEFNWGYLYKNATEEYNTVSYLPTGYPSGYWPMQFISATRGTNTIYMGAQDPDAWIKSYRIKSGEYFYFITYAEDMGVPGSDFPAPFPTHVGVLQGDWLDACKEYRKWALKQYWTHKGPISQREDFPESIKNLGIWILSGYDFEPGLEDESPHERNRLMLKAMNYFGYPIGVHWYHWHHMPFDNEYPHFFPPKPGFKERVKELVDNGLLTMPYINGLICDYDIPDFERFRPAAALDESGSIRFSVYGTSSGRMVPMCPTTDVWQGAITNLVDSLTGYYGVNGVYVDQVAASKPRPCFNPTHGHKLGGGSFWYNGYQELMQKVYRVANQRKAVITSEWTAECYMNVVDAFLSWRKPQDNEIPMLPAVYSGYTIYFASPSWLDHGDRAFIMNQGRVFAWGCQNGWMGLDLLKPEHRQKLAYLKKIGAYRLAARKFLMYGELVDMLEPIHHENIFSSIGGSSLEYAVVDKGGLPVEIPTITEHWPTHDGTPRDATLPVAMGAVWKSEDNHLGIVLTNFLNEPFEYTYRIIPKKYGISPKKGQQYIISSIMPEKTKVIGYHYDGPIIRTEKLGPREIKVLDIGIVNQ